MKILRNRTATRIFSLFTGLMFLNMSFFLTGISILSPEDKQLIENVGKLVLNEEEKDAHGTGTDTPLKVFPLLADGVMMRHSSLFLIAGKLHHDRELLLLHDGHAENFSPPPEVIYCVS